jgi:anti-sigma regulatory factor (Ser/Thr protein kinase)
MSSTRPFSPGDRGREADGASGVSEGGAAVPPEPPAGRQVRSLSFDGASGVVPLARDFARQALYAWGWLPAATADQRAAAEDVLLVVSELVTNACLHAEGPDELWITLDNKVIRIEVSDKGAGPPHPAPRGPPRRPRHVHRAAPLPGLGCGPQPRTRGQEGVGGAGRTGVIRLAGPGTAPYPRPQRADGDK